MTLDLYAWTIKNRKQILVLPHYHERDRLWANSFQLYTCPQPIMKDVALTTGPLVKH